MLKEGTKAPDFTLPSSSGEEVSLKDYLGKSAVVLYFYPRDNTSGCTKEACSFRDNMASLKKKNTVVLGVSPDSIKSHENFIQKHDLNFLLLSDPDHKVAEKYGAWGEKKLYGKTSMGIIRSTFIIDKNGVIRKVFPKVKVDGHGEEILGVLGQ